MANEKEKGGLIQFRVVLEPEIDSDWCIQKTFIRPSVPRKGDDLFLGGSYFEVREVNFFLETREVVVSCINEGKVSVCSVLLHSEGWEINGLLAFIKDEKVISFLEKNPEDTRRIDLHQSRD